MFCAVQTASNALCQLIAADGSVNLASAVAASRSQDRLLSSLGSGSEAVQRAKEGSFGEDGGASPRSAAPRTRAVTQVL